MLQAGSTRAQPPSSPFFPWPLAKKSKTTVRVCLSSQDTARQEASWTRKRQTEGGNTRMELELHQDCTISIRVTKEAG